MKSFTMIELLVVIAIIGILTSFLMPSLSNAREASKAKVCASNQKQIAIALNMYCDDNAGFFPYSRTANPRHLSWDDLVLPYDGRTMPTRSELDYPVLFASEGHQSGVHACPSDTVSKTHWTGTDLVPASYALTRRTYNGHGNLTGWSRGISGPNENAKCQSIQAIKNPSSTIALLEIASPNRRVGHGEDSLMIPNWQMSRTIPHKGMKGSNYLMVDGSVHFMSFWQTLITENGTYASPGWSIGSMWDSER